MAFVHGKDTVVIGDSTALTGDLNQIQQAFNRQAVDVTTFGNDDRVYLAGIGTGTISIGGLFNASVSDSDLNTAINTPARILFTVGPGGLTIGNRVYLHDGHIAGHANRSSQEDAVRMNASVTGEGASKSGVSLHDLEAETGTGNYTSVDNGANSSAGGIGHLHVTAFTGTSCVIKIQDSTDDALWDDLITFTSVTGTTQERATVSGTVNRYVRAQIASGTFTTVTFTVGFARKQA